MTEILALLGEEAEGLLGHECKGIPSPCCICLDPTSWTG